LASEKQIAANRRNAKKSTGPKTAAGRLTSSRNSFRYGLSLPLTFEVAESAKAERMLQMLVSDLVDEERVRAATEMAQAALELRRVGAIRTTMLAELDPASGDLDQLRRLAALDRYEARALTRRRRASRKLQG
jgi:hypothetical protein